MSKQLAELHAKYPGGIVVMGWWDGEPIWRHKTAQDKLIEAIGNKTSVANLYIAINETL